MAPLELLNTVWADRQGRHDDLADAEPALRELRDAARVLAADRTGDPRPIAEGCAGRLAAAVETVNRTSALAPGWPALEHGRVVRRTAATGADAELGRLAAEVVELFGSDVELRACLAPGCVLYFVRDHTRREWCSTGCGNRERAARHYARRTRDDVSRRPRPRPAGTP